MVVSFFITSACCLFQLCFYFSFPEFRNDWICDFFLFYWNSSVVSIQECPLGTFKNVTGSDKALCISCPHDELPHRAVYISVRGMTNDEMFIANCKGFHCIMEEIKRPDMIYFPRM